MFDPEALRFFPNRTCGKRVTRYSQDYKAISRWYIPYLDFCKVETSVLT